MSATSTPTTNAALVKAALDDADNSLLEALKGAVANMPPGPVATLAQHAVAAYEAPTAAAFGAILTDLVTDAESLYYQAKASIAEGQTPISNTGAQG